MTKKKDKRPRPSWAPADLSDHALQLIEGEQLLVDLGVRDLVAAIASADSSAFNNGVKQLRGLLTRTYENGVTDGRAHEAENQFRLRALWALGAAAVATVLSFTLGAWML